MTKFKETRTIGELPEKSVYRSNDEALYRKLNERYHVQTTLSDGLWLGVGRAERFDPNEAVFVAHLIK